MSASFKTIQTKTTINPSKICKKYLQAYKQVGVKTTFEFYINPGLR